MKSVARGLAGLAMSVLLLVGVSACDAVGVTSGSSPAGSASALDVGTSGGSGGGSSSSGSTSSVAAPASSAGLSISGSPPTTATVGHLYSFQPSASSSVTGTMTFAITGKPSWATFNAATGALSGTPASTNVGTTSGIKI